MTTLEGAEENGNSQCPLLRIYVLGTLDIQWPGINIPFPRERMLGRGAAPALGLLKAHLTQPDRFALRDWLMEQFWPKSPYSNADERLDDVASSLRGLLRPPESHAKILHFVYGKDGKGNGYRLEGYPQIWVDADAFEWYVQQAARLDRFGHDSLSLWEEAYQLGSRGEFLPDEWYSDWAQPRRELLQGQYRQCVHRVVQILRESGAYEQAILRLRCYWQGHQTDEDALRPLLEMLGERERYQEAEGYYEQAREAVRREEHRDLDERTRDVMECLRAQPIQRERAIQQALSVVRQTSSPHPIDIVRPDLSTVLSLSTHEQGRDTCLLSQSLKRAIIEAVREWGEAPMHSISILMEKGNMDRTKRDLLKLLGSSIVCAESGMSLQSFVTILGSGDRLGLFQQEMTMRWNVYHGGNTIQSGNGLHLWLGELEQFVKEVPQNEQISNLLNMSYQLHGSIFRDEMNYSEAHSAYKRAYFIADEFDNPELKSASLARRGVTFIQQMKPIDAIQYLEGALIFIKGYDLPCLECYIYQALSEAYAMAQQSQKSWSNVVLAEKALQRKNEVLGISKVSSNTTSVTSQKGVNAVLLKDYKQALTLLDAGLAKYDPNLRRGRARLIAQKAEACYGLGSIDESTKVAMEALTIAQTIGSQKTIDRIRSLYLLLVQSQYKNETGVIQLGRVINAV